MRGFVSIQSIGVAHQHAGADQEITEAGARGDATMPMMGCVGGRQITRVFPFPAQENTLMQNEHAIEDHRSDRLALAR